jgi:hypothetical protein
MEMKLSALVVIGIVMASVMMAFIPASSAIMWGTVESSVDHSAYYMTRYGGTAEPIKVTVTYNDLFPTITFLPAMISLKVTDKPTWLLAILDREEFVIEPGESIDAHLSLSVTQQDIEAGSGDEVVIEASGELLIPLGRTLTPTTTRIMVKYDPFTEISVSVASPIGEAAPDTKLRYPVKVTNLGNALVTVKLKVTKEPEGWEYVTSPTKVDILPKPPGEETYPYEYVYLSMQSPHGTAISYHNKWAGATIIAEATSESPTHVLEGEKWVERREPIDGVTYSTDLQTTLAKNKGFYVPGFDVLPVIAALGIVLVLVRKRKINNP